MLFGFVNIIVLCLCLVFGVLFVCWLWCFVLVSLLRVFYSWCVFACGLLFILNLLVVGLLIVYALAWLFFVSVALFFVDLIVPLAFRCCLLWLLLLNCWLLDCLCCLCFYVWMVVVFPFVGFICDFVGDIATLLL